MGTDTRAEAVATGERLIAILRRHVDAVGAAKDDDELDAELWEAVGAYGDELDALYGDDDEGPEDTETPEELTFTVRTRYDYTVVDEKKFLAGGQGIGAAVYSLLERAGGRVIPALEVDSLETGSGLLTVHINNEPLVADDFAAADEPTDLLLVDPRETFTWVLDEPVYGSRAEAEAAAKNDAQ